MSGLLELSYYDGFTPHLLGWDLLATEGTACVEAQWLDDRTLRNDRQTRSFTLPIPETRIEAIHAALPIPDDLVVTSDMTDCGGYVVTTTVGNVVRRYRDNYGLNYEQDAVRWLRAVIKPIVDAVEQTLAIR